MRLTLIITALISAVIFIFVGIAFNEKGIGFLAALYVATVSSVYSIVANAHYWIVILKFKFKSAGASIVHWLLEQVAIEM